MKYALFGIVLLGLLSGASAVPAGDRGPSAQRSGGQDRYELSEPIKRAVDRSAAELIVEPDGALRLETNGSHQHVYMARVGANGKIETYCASSERAVRAFLFDRPTREQ